MPKVNKSPDSYEVHSEAGAVDACGRVKVKDGNNQSVTIDGFPHDGMHPALKVVGASYGVHKFIGGSKDKPHWSATGN